MTNTGSTEHGDRKGKILKTCVALLILLILIKGCLPTTVRTNISDYETDLESVRGAADYLPKPDSLSGYKNIKYSYKRKDHILFTAIGMALFVEYDAEIYNNKKAEVLTGYEYLAEPIKASFNHENYSLPVTKYQYRGYTMKLRDCTSCKYFGMIGFNDEKCTIVYCYFADADLDLIGSEGDDLESKMVKFTNTYFKWR